MSQNLRENETSQQNLEYTHTRTRAARTITVWQASRQLLVLELDDASFQSAPPPSPSAPPTPRRTAAPPPVLALPAAAAFPQASRAYGLYTTQLLKIVFYSIQGMFFWDYGNAFLLESRRAGADVAARGIASEEKESTAFRYPSYVQDIMG